MKIQKEETPTRRRAASKKPEAEPKPQKAPTGECPYGYTFGKDTDEYAECDDCSKWDDCIEVKEGA